jgi:hypothetical protein
MPITRRKSYRVEFYLARPSSAADWAFWHIIAESCIRYILDWWSMALNNGV